jgi:hypothetical protein
MLTVQDSWIAQTADQTLVLTSAEGRVCRYRLRNGHLEYKPGPLSFWAVLSPAQTMQHLEINTVVAKWLRQQLEANEEREQPEL